MRAGRKRKAGLREPNGKPSRRNESVHQRAETPYAGWYVYVATAGGFTKIGYSGNIRFRLQRLKTEVGSEVKLLGTVACSDETDARLVEADMHKRCEKFRYSGEWFDMSEKQVISLLTEMKSGGMSVTGLDDLELMPIPRHKFSDANGRKFALRA